MRIAVVPALTLWLAASALVSPQTGAQAPPAKELLPKIDGRSGDEIVPSLGEHQHWRWLNMLTTPDIPGVVAGGTVVQLAAVWDPSGGGEGPIGAPDGSLLFLIPDQHKIMRLGGDGKLSLFLETQMRTTGLAFDPKGRLVGVQADSRGQNPEIAVLTPTRSVLVSGQPLGRPNDLVIDAKGGIYLTDLISRLPFIVDANGYQYPVPDKPGFKGAVRYRKPDGQLITVSQDVQRPNGIQLSPDGKTLYAGDFAGQWVMAFDVQPDGSVRNARNFARVSEDGVPSQANGMCIDQAGRLYATSPRGIQVFSPQGNRLGIIPIPIKPVNVAFAGQDKKSLYVVSHGGAAFRVAMLAEGIKSRAK